MVDVILASGKWLVASGFLAKLASGKWLVASGFLKVFGFGGLVLFFVSCAAGSMQRENTKALYEEYKSAAKYHAESESDYIILLENLERYPKEQELLIRKQILRKEIEQNRLLMLQARLEFEKALQEWDVTVQKMETGLSRDSIDLRQIFGLPSPKDTSGFGGLGN